MYKLKFRDVSAPDDYLLMFLTALYGTLVIASLVLFSAVRLSLFSIPLVVSGGVIPYVFLYPVSFIALRVYGTRTVLKMIASLIFVVFCECVLLLPQATSGIATQALHHILISSYKMYLAGLIAMPAGIYAAFLTLGYLSKYVAKFSVFTIILATTVGGLVNTLIVFPIGFHGTYSLNMIFSEIIVDTLIFKLIAGVVLSVPTIMAIKLLVTLREE